MPASHQSPTASEPTAPPTENAAVQRAYCLISQLRGPGPETPSLPRTTLKSRDWLEIERETDSRRVVDF